MLPRPLWQFGGGSKKAWPGHSCRARATTATVAATRADDSAAAAPAPPAAVAAAGAMGVVGLGPDCWRNPWPRVVAPPRGRGGVAAASHRTVDRIGPDNVGGAEAATGCGCERCIHMGRDRSIEEEARHPFNQRTKHPARAASAAPIEAGSDIHSTRSLHTHKTQACPFYLAG